MSDLIKYIYFWLLSLISFLTVFFIKRSIEYQQVMLRIIHTLDYSSLKLTGRELNQLGEFLILESKTSPRSLSETGLIAQTVIRCATMKNLDELLSNIKIIDKRAHQLNVNPYEAWTRLRKSI